MAGGPWSDFFKDVVGGDSNSQSSTNRNSDNEKQGYKYDTGDSLDPVEDNTREELVPSTIEEIDRVYFGDLGKNNHWAVKIISGEKVLIIDPENFNRDEWLALESEFNTAFYGGDGLSIESASEIAAIAKDKSKREYVDDFCEFYKDRVPHRFYKMIKESMYLRLSVEQEGLAFDEVRHRKSQIAKHTNRDQEAFAISSLCSAGYLDEGRFFRQMYSDMVEQGSQTVQDYQDAFVEIVVDRAFVTFVKSEDTAKEVYHEVIGKSLHVDKYDYKIEFIDICGKGEFNRETIKEVIDYMETHHEEIEYQQVEEEDQLTYRIDPTTF